ncbi:MAG: hypothetical protein AB1750_15760 [Chloroflexota bacterium]
MKTKLTALLILLLLAQLACRSSARQTDTPTQPPATVPEKYQALYDYLDQTLDADLATLRADPGAGRADTIFAAELIVANGNRGEDLLRPETLPAVTLYLDRLQAMGVRGVKNPIPYPLLKPDFPRSEEYLEFYRNVAKEIRAHDMTWTVQAGILFANLPFSPVAYDFSQLTFEQYKGEDRAMVETILRELQPDYLVLMGEPDTQANLTGLREFNDPQKGVELVNYLLDGLDRGATKICAGTGSWTPPEYARLLSEKTSLDCVSIHVYPVNPQFIQNALRMAQDARANGKSVIVPESWLYKTDQPGGGEDVAATADIFKLDAYSFWTPLDRKFIQMMADFAGKADVDFLSFFWSQFFFAYVDYAPSLDDASYSEIRERSNRAASEALARGELSPLGQFYQTLINGP